MYGYKRTIFFQCQKTYQRKNVNVIQRGPEITSEKQMTMPHQVRIRNVTSSPFLSGNRHTRKRFISVAKINNAKSIARDFSSIIFQRSSGAHFDND